jgi:hypothetical protein
VTRFPDPRHPSHLASITFKAQRPSAEIAEWAAAIELRRSDRRPMSSWEVPEGHVLRLADLAAEYGIVVRPLTETQASAWERLADEARSRSNLPGYRAELYEWTHRSETSRDGIPADNRTPVDEVETLNMRRLPPGNLPLSGPATDNTPQAIGLLLSSSSDDQLARLRAGEALSAILLEATRLGLATAIDSQVIEVPSLREAVEQDLLDGERSPQVLVTVGWPSSADPIPQTLRRHVSDILSATVADDEVLSRSAANRT